MMAKTGILAIGLVGVGAAVSMAVAPFHTSLRGGGVQGWRDPPSPSVGADGVRERLLASGHFKIPASSVEADAAAKAAEAQRLKPPRPVAAYFISGAPRVVIAPKDGKVESVAVGETVDGWRVAEVSPDDAFVTFEREGEREVINVVSGKKQ